MPTSIARVTRLSGDRYEVVANVGPPPFSVVWERTWTLEGAVARALLDGLSKTVQQPPKEG